MAKSARSPATTRLSNGSERPGSAKPPGELNDVVRHHLASLEPAEVLHAYRVRLTKRERSVLCAFLRHSRMDSAARQLGTSVQTVRNQLASIRRKLQTRSIPELITKVLISVLCGSSSMAMSQRSIS